ncbi:MAG TPA: PAS domain-containing protein [Victivallales bacterium]|nr:PAS domain-containing protein [Victivallales bacterium]
MFKFDKYKFKKLRKSSKLSQQKIADVIGKASYRTILRWEQGISKPTEGEVRLLAEIMHVPISEISDLKELFDNNTPYFYDNLTNLDKSIFDISAKTDSEKQKTIIDLMKQNKMLNWQLQEQKKVISNITTTVNSLNYLIYRKNRALKYTFVNDFFLSYFGFPGSNLVLGQRNSDIWKHQKSWEEISELEKNVFESNVALENTIISIPKTFGTGGSGVVNIKPVYDNNDKIIEIIVSIKDISGEQSLNEKYFYLESALEKLEHVIWIIKSKPYRHFLYINSAIERIYGVGKNEFYRDVDFWIKFVHKEDIKKVKKEFNNQKEELIYRIYVRNKEIHWVQHFLYRTIVKDTELEFGVIKDITKEMNNEKIRHMMETTINSMKETFGLTGPNSCDSLYFSKSRAKIYGYSMDKLIKGGHDFWLKTCVHPDDYEKQKKYSDDNSWPTLRRFRIIRGDGQLRWLETRRIRIIFDGQLCSGYFESDITDQIKKENKQKKNIDKAYLEGYQTRNLEMSKSLKEKQISPAIISKVTGLSKTEIEKLN